METTRTLSGLSSRELRTLAAQSRTLAAQAARVLAEREAASERLASLLREQA